ncbi:MAG: hypothetical protein RIR07_617 [Bacteroidota bacterium]
MAKENKTQPTAASVTEFLQALPKPQQREDSLALDAMMRKVTGYEPTLWGKIVGYGRFDYRYPTGRSGKWFGLGFAPRATELSIYLSLGGGEEPFSEILARLGKYKMGAGCLYLKRLSDVDLTVLAELLTEALARNKANPVLTEVLE